MISVKELVNFLMLLKVTRKGLIEGLASVERMYITLIVLLLIAFKLSLSFITVSVSLPVPYPGGLKPRQ